MSKDILSFMMIKKMNIPNYAKYIGKNGPGTHLIFMKRRPRHSLTYGLVDEIDQH